MPDDISTLTVREWVTIRLLRQESTSSVDLKRHWGTLRYRGSVHDALYRLEKRGYAVRESADYHPAGTSWRLSDRGLEVKREVQAMLTSLSRRL